MVAVRGEVSQPSCDHAADVLGAPEPQTTARIPPEPFERDEAQGLPGEERIPFGLLVHGYAELG